MNDKKFIEETFELAFGDGAINRQYSREEVITELTKFANQSGDAIEILQSSWGSFDDFEAARKEFEEKYNI